MVKARRVFKYGCPRCGDLHVNWGNCFNHMKVCCEEELQHKKRQSKMARCRLGHPSCVVPRTETYIFYTCPGCRAPHSTRLDCMKHTIITCCSETTQPKRTGLRQRIQVENTHHGGEKPPDESSSDKTHGFAQAPGISTQDIENDFVDVTVWESTLDGNSPKVTTKRVSMATFRMMGKRSTDMNDNYAYGCPRCHILCSTWKTCLSHIKGCCAEEFLNKKGLQQRCQLDHARCVLPVAKCVKNGSPSRTTDVLAGEFVSRPDIHATNGCTTSKETSKRLGISNLPAWMTRTSGEDVVDSRRLNLGVTATKENDVKFNATVESKRSKDDFVSEPDTSNVCNTSKETSKRLGISNLPAWMARKPASTREDELDSGHPNLGVTTTNVKPNATVEFRKLSEIAQHYDRIATTRPKRQTEPEDDEPSTSTKTNKKGRMMEKKKKKVDHRCYRCPRCMGLFNAWNVSLEHMVACCPEQLLRRKGLQQRCTVYDQSRAVPDRSTTAPSLNQSYASLAHSPTSSSIDLQHRDACCANIAITTNDCNTPKETSRRHGVSNLPAWMTRKSSGKLREKVVKLLESKKVVKIFRNGENLSVIHGMAEFGSTTNETTSPARTDSIRTIRSKTDTPAKTNHHRDTNKMNAELFSGWESAIDSESNTVYFYNQSTGATCWEYPSGASEYNILPQAPSGWDTVVDKESARVYFYNIATGKTSWEYPVHSS